MVAIRETSAVSDELNSSADSVKITETPFSPRGTAGHYRRNPAPQKSEAAASVATAGRMELVMSIGNQKFGIPRKYQYQIGVWYFCPKFLGIFLVFYRYFEKALVKIWLNIGVFGRTKIGLVFGFCSCHFIGIGLVSV